MLRASIEYEGGGGRLNGIAEGAKVGDSGIEYGERLTAFADAAVHSAANSSGDSSVRGVAALDAARDALREVAGSECVVDAAGVIGNFERMVRIADGTGIPLDGIVEVMSSDFREELGLEDFESRRPTQLGFLGRTFGPILKGAIKTGLRVAGRRTRRRNPPERTTT
jgi:hypothetical protein